MYTKDGTPNGVVFTPDHHMARCSLWHAIKFHRGEQSASRTGYVGRRKGMNGGCSAEIDDIIDECHDDKDRSGFDVHRGTPAGVVVSFPTGDVFFSSKMLRGDPWQR